MRCKFLFVGALSLALLGGNGIEAQAEAAQASTISVGDQLPRWDKLKPGTTRYLRYREENGRRIALDIWTRTLSIDLDPVTRVPRLHILQEWNGATLPVERKVDSWFEMKTFRPLLHRTTRQTKEGTTTAAFVFHKDKVSGDPSMAENSQASLNVPTPEPTFNFETDMELLATLPWRADYVARINFYHPGGGAPDWYEYRVAGSERLSLGGRSIDAWVVAIDYGALGDARFWIDKDTQTVLKVATRGPDIKGTLYKMLLPSE